jgi:transporter family protein
MWIVLALLSGSCAAILAVLVKLYLKHINPLFITLVFSVITIIMLLVVDLLTSKVDSRLVTSLTYKEWIPLIIGGCLNGFAFICYLGALKGGRAGSALAIDRLGIVFALILAAIFLQEAFSLKALFGAIIMVAGAFLITT